ncbi:Nidogen-like protein, partial [Teladorsagia circumcincta]
MEDNARTSALCNSLNVVYGIKAKGNKAIWLTDQPGRLSYVILNYDRLGFDAQDFRANSRSGRCRALFNGGNHTGVVEVDPTQAYKNTPK